MTDRRTRSREARALDAPQAVEPQRLRFAVWVTALALPILVIDNIPANATAPVQVTATGGATGAEAAAAVEADRQVADAERRRLATLATQPTPAPTTTAAPPTTTPRQSTTTTPPAPTTTTSAPRADPTTTTTAARAAPSPPTTAAPSPPPPTPPPGDNVEVGGASYYDHVPGGCAHRTLPLGTVVTVTNLASGATTTCTVNDRGPFIAGRIIDLERSDFAKIAAISVGVIQVRISW